MAKRDNTGQVEGRGAEPPKRNWSGTFAATQAEVDGAEASSGSGGALETAPDSNAPDDARAVPRVSGVAPVGGVDERVDSGAAAGALRAAATPSLPDFGSREPLSEQPRSSVRAGYADEAVGPPPTRRAIHPYDAALIKLLHKAFTKHAGRDKRLDAGELRDALGLDDVFLAKRLLRVLGDSATSQGPKQPAPMITRAEFVDRVARLVSGDDEDKLRFAFCIHDLDGDGYVQRAELLKMMTACLAEELSEEERKAMKLDPAGAKARQVEHEQDADKLTQVLLRAIDKDNDKRLSYKEFAGEVRKHPGLFELITRSEARWIVQAPELLTPFRERRGLWQRLSRQLNNRLAPLTCLALWTIGNVALFVAAAIRYQESGGWVMVARGCGACLNFNGALILVPVMRRLLTRIRQARMLTVLPVDDAIAFHRLVGHAMFIFALVHTGAHLMNYHMGGYDIVEPLWTVPAATSGLYLLLLFGLMWGFSFLRRSKKFELFYFTHWLYVGWFALLLLHGPVFYLWAALPVVGFVIDWVLRRASSARATEVLALEPLASRVTRVEIQRPEGFSHNPGDYAFLRIPALARHEWHPFTISSAPERDTLTMHVRSLGNFTKALRGLAERHDKRVTREPLGAHLDGPYGSPSRRIFEVDNVVLIGAGIGVTPFASVLESIVLRAQQGPTCPRKVHFFWLNGDAYSFEWFHDLLTRLEQMDQGRVVDIHIYMTSGRGHVTATFLNLARELLHQQGNPDLLTGLKSKTNMGRPDWGEELARIADQHAPDSVEVFFCGPPGLGRQLKQVCRDLGLRFHAEDF